MEYNELSKIILDEIKSSSPDNIEKLINEINSKHNVPKGQILEVLSSLVDSHKVDLKLPSLAPRQFSNFIFSVDATWFWVEVALSTFAVMSIFLINDNTSPLIYVRNIMGFIFSLYLPGYGFIKAVLPYREFSELERIILSVGSSIALVPFVGMFLNYFNSLSVVPILLCLFITTIIFSIIGIIRDYNKNIAVK